MARRSRSRSAQGRRTRKKKVGKRWILVSALWATGLLSLCAAGAYLWMDYTIRDRFSNPLWEIPIHIYSRSFEIYTGLPITPDQLRNRLDGIGFRRTRSASRAGEYAQNGSAIDLVTRQFNFWDGPQDSRPVRLNFNPSGIESVKDIRTGQAISVLRLKPRLIGSVAQIQHEDRYLIRLDDAPKLLLSTLVAVEDRNFTKHRGVDFRGIARSMWVNLRAGRIVQGGSTLTQQLIKNVYGANERTYRRKLIEIAMALVMERRLKKHQILEAYCNEVFLGQDGQRAIHGFGLASHYFFGRPIAELNVAEIALLVGLIKAPSGYDPRRNPERARERRLVVLNVMKRDGLINETEYRKSRQASLGIVPVRKNGGREFASFVDVVVRQLSERLGARQMANSEFSVFTTMDIEVQRAAERALVEQVASLESRHGIAPGTLQGAVVVARPDSGELLAIAGGIGAYVGSFNRAVDSRRPIGSLIKPVVYLSAFMQDRNWTLATQLSDRAFTHRQSGSDDWTPRNYDDEYLGDITVLEALAKSRNIPAARLGLKIGVEDVANNMKKLGVDVPRPVYPSLLLGAVELSPMEVVRIYQTIANYGYRLDLRSVTAITRNSLAISDTVKLRAKSVVPTDPVYLTLFAMQEAVAIGTARGLLNEFDPKLSLAGKTGTTNGYRDSWFVGISGNYLAAVWLGRDDNQPTGLTGSSGAMKVWSSMMKRLNLQALRLASDNAIEFEDIDLDSGMKASTGCTNILRLPFVRGTAPTRRAACTAADRR